jgi:hypothetical protein
LERKTGLEQVLTKFNNFVGNFEVQNILDVPTAKCIHRLN